MSPVPKWSSPFRPRVTAAEVLEGLDLAGQVALVTGANSGIGFETARALAARGAGVILACRDRVRAEGAVQRIRDRHPEAQVEQGLLDLACLSNVRRFTDGFPVDKLDMLICNAGVLGGGYHETADGFERTVGVCHIGHFLLVSCLLSRLRASGTSRVVMVSSESHRRLRTLDFSKLPLERESYSDMVAYRQAKLCNVIFANELQRRYQDEGINAFALHPGDLVPTAIGRHSRLIRILIQLLRPFTKSIAQGAATSVLCAAHPSVAKLGGHYFADCRLKDSSPASTNPDAATRLWALSTEWIADPPGRRA